MTYLLLRGVITFDFGCSWYNKSASYLTFSSSSYNDLPLIERCNNL